MSLDPPTVSLIIPVRDGGDAFVRCLAAVGRLDPPPAETVVVDDGSHDGSGDRAEAAGARVLRRASSGGPALARNQGGAVAAGDVLLFLDADVEAPPGTVGRVQSWFAPAPADANEPPDGVPDGVIGSYDAAPAGSGALSRYRNLLHRWVHQRSRPEVSTFWSGCGAVRAAAFHAVGGFDESYTAPSIEDIELGGRLAAAGFRVVLDPELEVKHLKRWTLGSMLATDVLRRAIPWTRLMVRRGGLSSDLNLAASGRWSAAAAVLATGAVLALPWLDGAPAMAAGVVAALGMAIVGALNLPFYRFLRRRGGTAFALFGAACHWAYFLYAVAGFAIGLVLGLADRLVGRRAGPSLPEQP